jgi:hypothetical protein
MQDGSITSISKILGTELDIDGCVCYSLSTDSSPTPCHAIRSLLKAQGTETLCAFSFLWEKYMGNDSVLRLISIVGYPNTIVYDWNDLFVIRTSDLSLSRKQADSLFGFLRGQTLPVIEGFTLQDFVYFRDYRYWLDNIKE